MKCNRTSLIKLDTRDSLVKLRNNVQDLASRALRIFDTASEQELTIRKVVSQLLSASDTMITKELDFALEDIITNLHSKFVKDRLPSKIEVSSLKLPLSSLEDEILNVYGDAIILNTRVENPTGLTLLYSKEGAIFLCVTYAYSFKLDETMHPLCIDIDSHRYMIDSNSNKFCNTTNFDEARRKYQTLLGSLQFRTQGSKNYYKCIFDISKLEARIKNICFDAWHKTANHIVENTQPIFVIKSYRTNRLFMDTNHSMYCSNNFLHILKIKAEQVGIPIVFVPESILYAKLSKSEEVPLDLCHIFMNKYPEMRLELLKDFAYSWVKSH